MAKYDLDEILKTMFIMGIMLFLLALPVGMTISNYLDYKVKTKAIEALKTNVELKLSTTDLKELLKWE